MTTGELISNFESLGDWEHRYAYLVDLGRKLPALAEPERIDANRVNGCQATVWLHLTRDPGNPALVRIRADSNAAIVRGLIAVLVILFDGKTPDEIAAADARRVFAKLRLDQHLSPTRKNGLFAMVERIRREAGRLPGEAAPCTRNEPEPEGVAHG